MQRVNHFLTSLLAIGAVHGVADISPDDLPKIVQALVQVAIAIATFWKLFRKEKK